MFVVGSSRIQELIATGLSRADVQKQAITEARKPVELPTAVVSDPQGMIQ